MMDLQQLIDPICSEIGAEYMVVGDVFKIVVPLEDDLAQEVLVHLEEDEDEGHTCVFSSWIKDLDPDRFAPQELPDLLDHLLDLLSRNEEFLYVRIAWDPNDGALKIVAKNALEWLEPELFQNILLEVAEEAQFLQEDFGDEET